MSQILAEVEKATAVPRNEDEDLNHWYQRLIKSVTELPNDDWETLSAAAQIWINDNIVDQKVADPVAPPSDLSKREYKAQVVASGGDEGHIVKINTKGVDQFGLRAGTKASEAAAMFAQGAKMAAVNRATGTNHYNLINRLRKQGHIVSRQGSVITIKPKP